MEFHIWNNYCRGPCHVCLYVARKYDWKDWCKFQTIMEQLAWPKEIGSDLELDMFSVWREREREREREGER